MATKKKTTTRTQTKKAQPKKTAKPAETAPKKDEKPKEPRPNRVFAIRITDEELAAIHEASGPRNATRFIRAVAAAFASEDVKAFEAVLKEARELR